MKSDRWRIEALGPLAAGALLAASSASCASSDAEPAPALPAIPVALIETQIGESVYTVQVSVGGSAPFTALLDTGSVGLYVVDGVVPESNWEVTSTPSSVTYGSGVVADGVLANATVAVGGLATNSPVPVVKITKVSCDGDHPSCIAAGKTASSFLFQGSFPAILGIGLRATVADGLASPLAAIGKNKQYILALPPFGGDSGTLTIDPPAPALARFQQTMIQLPSFGPATANGIAAWDDTKVPFCINALCVVGILDTGANAFVDITGPDDDKSLGVPAGAAVVPGGTAVDVTIDKTASWSFTVGKPPTGGKDLIQLITGASLSDSLGVLPFHQFDVLYDNAAGQIGLAPKSM